MTDFDKGLIKKAQEFNRWNYRDIDVLIGIADTPEGCQNLQQIRSELYDLVCETI